METNFWTIEFELDGKPGKRLGVSQGETPHEAMQNFLSDYPTSGDCEHIVAISCKPEFQAGHGKTTA
jgi:hypothetical protein